MMNVASAQNYVSLSTTGPVIGVMNKLNTVTLVTTVCLKQVSPVTFLSMNRYLITHKKKR